MHKLSDKLYWNQVHQERLTRSGGLPKGCRQTTSPLANLILRPYSDYVLWDTLLPRYLPVLPGARVVEIGSAPGYNLVRLHQRFGYIPYGIEYSEYGVELNKAVFAACGLPTDNVIRGDLFSPDIRNKFKHSFYVVFSAGLIEHFTDVRSAVLAHLDLLCPGGYLVVGIPNLSGLNLILQRFFSRGILAQHNTTIMEKARFAALFEQPDLLTLFCDYYGTINLNLYAAPRASWRGLILKACKVFQLWLNPVCRMCLGPKGLESRAISPYLLYIGRRMA